MSAALPAIAVQAVHKEYLLYASPAQRFLDLLLRRRSRARRFHALDGVELQVARGETVGLLGRNGAGKSTLLSIIAGVVQPTAGTVQVHGRVGALLELGAGFHPEYSGRDNARLAASLLGLTRREIDQKMDSIVAFADIGEHIDQPVRTYSSGMFVRLAFAVHAALEPEVLIVDEALAVGDAAFQAKCYRRLRELKERGTAILLVTHDIQTVRLFCERAVWLDHGRIRMQGSPQEVGNAYLEALYAGAPPTAAPAAVAAGALPQVTAAHLPERGLVASVDLSGPGAPAGAAARWGEGGGRLRWAALYRSHGTGSDAPMQGEALRVVVQYRCDLQPVPADLSVAVTVLHRKSLELLGASTSAEGMALDRHGNSVVQVEFTFDNLLAPDDYALAVALWRDEGDTPRYLDFVSGVLPFSVGADRPTYALVRPKVSIVSTVQA
ncbi:MAG: ABC transporter ATP-binding protein [Burkholderiales bacterium]|jgi:lipopolysaccharide transport system ATP-binding protein|nr:ABC transporter ATP-binding protein [Burkholderiales bacterium]